MIAILRSTRAGDWWSSKIPPLLSVAFGVTLFEGVSWDNALPALARLIVAICGVAAYGYVINDIFDIEEDRRAGKPNTMEGLSPVGRSALAILFFAIALAPISDGTFGWVSIVLALVNMLLPTLYSIPPIRLKERGVLGVMADSLGAQGVPTVFFGVSMIGIGGGDPRSFLFVGIAALWAFTAGLRGILVHQAEDRASDLDAGTETFAGGRSLERIKAIVFYRLFPAELAAFAAMLVVLIPHAALLWVALALFAVIESSKMALGWRLPLIDSGEEDQRYVPMASNEFYEVWLPFTLATQLAVGATPYLWAPVLVVVLFRSNFRRRLSAIPNLVKGIGDVPWRYVLARVLPIVKTPRNLSASARVYVGATYWSLNGVNVFSANLVRGLRKRGVDAVVLLTEENTFLVENLEGEFARPDDIPFAQLPVDYFGSWGEHWGGLVRFLEAHSPCIYIPNSDYRHSCVMPFLSPAVRVVGVVHSDDPLHYDHVARLGSYWNRIVTTSTTIAAKVLAGRPELSDRLSTIPIGVSIPETIPPKDTGDGSLRIIYHGMLKQYQKRILDLPRIMSAVEKRGIRASLTIAGAGPQEEELLAACRGLIDRGVIDFKGMVPHHLVGETLAQHDVYILTSEFEGMPNALLEAMGRGCVPLATRMESGIPDLVTEGETGFLVGIGDTDAFVDRIELLQRDVSLRTDLARAAHARVQAGPYNVEHMVDSYHSLFNQVSAEDETTFRRPRGELNHVPAVVDGVSVFPVEFRYRHQGLGDFPSLSDWHDFRDELELTAEARLPVIPRAVSRARRRRRQRAARKTRVIVGAPNWIHDGINRHTSRLVRGLRELGVPARILLTEESTDLVNVPGTRMERHPDLPIDELPVKRSDDWGAHWGAMIRYLERRAPCIYIPNHDWRHSCVSGLLPDNVYVVGILHGDNELDYEHAGRLGKYWNAVVAHSDPVAGEIQRRFPELAPRLANIVFDLARTESDRDDLEGRGLPFSGTGAMARAYVKVFERLLADIELGVYRRPPGRIEPPPARIGDVSILPVDFEFQKEGIGPFVDARHYRSFRRKRRALFL